MTEPVSVEELRERIDAALEALGEACVAGRVKMSIPVSDSDQDMVIGKALSAAGAAADEIDRLREELVDLREENEALDREVQDVLSDYAEEATENANAQTELADWRAGRKAAWRSFEEREPGYGEAILVTGAGQAATITYKGLRWHWTHWAPFNPPEGK